MHTLALERIEVCCQGGHQGLTFTSLEFGHVAFVQHHRANQLHIIMPLANHPVGHFAHHCKGIRQDSIKRRAFLVQALLEDLCLLG